MKDWAGGGGHIVREGKGGGCVASVVPSPCNISSFLRIHVWLQNSPCYLIL